MQNQCIIDLTPQCCMMWSLMLSLGDWFISDRFANALWVGPKRCGALFWVPALFWCPPTLWCLNIQIEVCLASIRRFSNRRYGGVNITWRWDGYFIERCRLIWKTWWAFIGSRSIADNKLSLKIFQVNYTTAIKLMQRQCIIILTPQCCVMWNLKQALGDIFVSGIFVNSLLGGPN